MNHGKAKEKAKAHMSGKSKKKDGKMPAELLEHFKSKSKGKKEEKKEEEIRIAKIEEIAAAYSVRQLFIYLGRQCTGVQD